MWRNYVVIGYRNLARSKSASIVNVLGLTVAIGCCIVVFLFLDRRASMDAYHQDAGRIYLVESLIEQNGDVQTWCSSPAPLAPALVEAFPQVRDFVRINTGTGTVQRGDDVFDEAFWYVDPNYLDVFTFPLRYGRKDALRQDDAVILSDEAARKYFGDQDPTGQTLNIRLDGTHATAFTVRGVALPFPATSSFRFNILLPYDRQRALGRDLDRWGETTAAAFIRVNRPAVVAALKQQMAPFVAAARTADAGRDVVGYAFGRLTEISGERYRLHGAIFMGMHPITLFVFPALAALILALACFNYVNVAIGQATRRMKEIGVRKVMGGTRWQLIQQFVAENLLVCSFALAAGLLLAQYVLLPAFNGYLATWEWTSLDLSFPGHPSLWLFLAGLLAVTALLSGAYPALYVASFQPTNIFRGKHRLAGSRWLIRGLMLLQLALAFYAVTNGIVMVENARYEVHRDPGYHPEGLVEIRVRNGERYRLLREQLRRDPFVVRVAGARQCLGRTSWSAEADVAGTTIHARRFDVSPGYFETLGLRLASGRFFDTAHPGDVRHSVVVNETFARTAGRHPTVGMQLRLDGLAWTVVGVVRDFAFEGAATRIEPVVMLPAPADSVGYLAARLRPGATAALLPLLQDTWKSLFPDVPFDGFFQDTLTKRAYEGLNDIVTLSAFQALLALLLSCLGFYGLMSQNVGRRAREIGIRKMLGASSMLVAEQVNRPFLLLLGAAAAVAAPLSYLVDVRFLDALYAYHVKVGSGAFVLSYLLVLVTVAAATSSQIRRVLRMNPADVLKME